jgi:type VI secretion system protein ImpA
MSSPEILDFEMLLSPCENNSPFGDDSRLDSSINSLYFKVKDARSAARSIERATEQGNNPENQTPDWDTVVELSEELISTKAKDLEIASYLIEGLARTNGFPGIRDGFKLIKEITENFWDGLYPSPDEDGLLTKIGPINALNGIDSEGVLLQPIRRISLTTIGSTRCFSMADWINVCKLENLDQDTLVKRIERGAPNPQEFHATVSESSAEFFLNLLEDIEECKSNLKEMSDLIDNKCGTVLSQTSSLKNLLVEIQDALKIFAADKIASAQRKNAIQEQNSNEDGNENIELVSVQNQSGGRSQVRTRDEALKQLKIISEFFLRTEPHSPLSYSISQSVRWGKLSLPELLSELIPDHGAREYISKVTGLRLDLDSGAISASGENQD